MWKKIAIHPVESGEVAGISPPNGALDDIGQIAARFSQGSLDIVERLPCLRFDTAGNEPAVGSKWHLA